MEILGLVNIPVWLILLLFSLLFLYVYGTWNYSLWTSQGIPGPKPWPLVGNLREERQKGYFRVYTDWSKKYGRVVGHFRGVIPQLTVTDLEFVREVMIKNFNNFTDRNIPKGSRPRMVTKGLLFAEGATWKRIRSMMTPTFSTSKLKMMSRFINRCSTVLVGSIEKKARADEVIDIKEVFGAFTMDVIAGTGFGLETNSQTEADEPFVRQCKALFKNAGLKGIQLFLYYIATAFPFVAPVLGRLLAGPTFFFSAVEKMVDERREENTVKEKKSPDLLQMLVDAEADPETITDLADDADDSKSNRRLTREEIIAQGLIVLVAGYETTATTLQYLTYNLTMHPDIQEKVYRELRDELGDAEPTYENLAQLKYLDMTVRETLRIFPPASIVGRRAVKDSCIQGVNIPKGCGVIIPITTILHDPEYFPNPEVFDPERFSEENISKIHPVTVELAFGYGPRKCIGMRLALLEVKFAAAKLFQRFRFVKCSETPETITMNKLLALAMPERVVKVKAEIRSA